jgi:hypothetical protein
VTLTPLTDLSAAGWIAASDQPWNRLVTMGPAGFSAYARLRFIPDPMNGGQSESDVGRDDESPSDADQLRTAVETLLPHTRTPDEGYLLIWEGWGRGAFPRGAFTAPRLTLPDRACLMFRVRLPDFASGAVADRWESARHYGDMPEPAFIWPADRAWCITCDVDPHWAGIGVAPDAIEALLDDPRLDVVRADPDAEQPFYRG